MVDGDPSEASWERGVILLLVFGLDGFLLPSVEFILLDTMLGHFQLSIVFASVTHPHALSRVSIITSLAMTDTFSTFNTPCAR